MKSPFKGTNFFARASNLIGLLALLCSSNLFAGAWVHEQGKSYSEVSFGYYSANSTFDQNGNKVANILQLIPNSVFTSTASSTYTQYSGNLYVEYGLGWDLEANAQFPFLIKAKQDIPSDVYHTQGIGDAIVGLKYKWLDLPALVSSAEVSLGIPVGDEVASGKPGNSGFPSQRIPLGDGEYDLSVIWHASHSFQTLPFYASTAIGYRFRDLNGGTPFSNDLPLSIDGGYTLPLFKDKSYLSSIVFSFGTRALVSLKTPPAAQNIALVTSGNVAGQSFVDVQPGIFLNLWSKLALNMGYSYTVWGENTGAGWGVRTGLAWVN